jgi:hypothetical protein
LPRGLALKHFMVDGPAAGRFTADAGKLRSLLEALDIRDLDVPQNIDGKSVTVRKPPVVVEQFVSENRRATLLQARNPEVELPAGVNLAQLAEIGMRIIGVDRAQARRLAETVDWHSTLLVPVPPNASSFRSVEVNGNPGLIVTTKGAFDAGGSQPAPGGSGGVSDSRPGGKQRDCAVVLWSENTRVFALVGDLNDVEMMQMAESVH